MKTDIILAGVGGQGILSIAAVIGTAAISKGLYIKQAEVHGMSQRGGAVESHLRISDKPIASDLIPIGKADMIISVEPMESLRYLQYLAPDGWLITNTTPFINIDGYPEISEIMAEIKKRKNHVAIDANSIAKDLGMPKSSNIVILGAAASHLNLTFEDLQRGVKELFGRKGEEMVNANLKALAAGRNAK